jgi:hypothetical protein
MVDTINPNTNAPDNWDNNPEPTQPAAPDNRFYGGFDKPDETKINLADSGQTVASNPQPEEVPQPQPAPPQPVADVAPVKPAEVQHTSYVNTANMINWRGIIVIFVIGLGVTVLAGVGMYFGINALNNSKITQQQSELDKIKNEVSSLDVTPDPLELPESETPPVEEAPVVVPVETPIETPIVVPVEEPSPTSNG